MTCVAVTGTAGFIGTHVAEALLNAGFTVFASEFHKPIQERLRPRLARIVRGDLSEPEIQLRLLEGADAVCHASAYIPPRGGGPEERAKCYHHNAIVSHDLALASVRLGIGHFTFISNGNIYKLGGPAADERGEIEIKPAVAPYFISKLAAEYFVQAALSKAATGAILRVTTPYGIGEPESKVVPTFLNAALRGDRLRLLGTGAETLNLVAVEDVAKAVVESVVRSAAGVFNVSGGCVAMASLAATCLRLQGREEGLVDVLGGSNAASFAAVDCSRAHAELGWQPRSLESGLRAYAAAMGAT